MEVGRKEDVVAAPQYGGLPPADLLVFGEVVAQRGGVVELHDAVGDGGDAETVPPRQVGMQDLFYHNDANLSKISGIVPAADNIDTRSGRGACRCRRGGRAGLRGGFF